ncbi:MAG: MBL fold metallo-hydrolase [Herpetosiphonaceae bacterium]|nr:MBL fold metallo-hydrolase [Herpetosiphonaceae bacterium]
MRLTLLGTGTSMGVPVIGCDCTVCTSPDPRNRRTRTAALLEARGTTILIDAGPDMRMQVLRHHVTYLDAVLLTHGHADHVGGIDDLRPFTMHSRIAARRRGPLPIYGDAATIARVRHQFDYAFDPAPSLSTRPSLATHVLNGPFRVNDLDIIPFTVNHGPNPITGYRFGRCGYITDGKTLPPATMQQLHGLDLLIINALRFTDHPLHFTVDEAVAVVEELQPRQALFVHMTHDFDHATVNAQLPPHIQLGYDGQVVELADD